MQDGNAESRVLQLSLNNRAFQSAVFNSGQKMALRAFYFVRALTKTALNAIFWPLLKTTDSESLLGMIRVRL